MKERMPMIARDAMDDAQRQAADALIAGPRKGVKGPFVALLRSPELMDRLQRVGEYLRFGSSLEARLNEFAMAVVAREWTNHFEWTVHAALAAKAGVARDTLEAVREGRRPAGMAEDEALVFDFVHEVLRNKGVSDATYERTVKRLGERGLMDLMGLVGYFVTICMVMNVAHAPAPEDPSVTPMTSYPL